MIVFRSLIKTYPKQAIPKILTTNKFPFCSTDPNPKQQHHAKITSQQHRQQFQLLINDSEQSSLEKAAQMLAILEVEVEQNQQQIKYYEGILENCPAKIKSLIQKVQVVRDNIKQQEEQNQAIQRRAEKEIADCRNFSISSIAKQVLDVADALVRCKKLSIDHHKSQDHEVVVSIQNAEKQIRTIFERYGIKQFDPIGEQYDPNKQEALGTVQTPDDKLKNKVVHTMRTGYTIKGRLLRSAHVAIYQ